MGLGASREEGRTFKGFKEDLIAYYREHESQIPASPLVEEHKVALEDLYVIPPMWAYDNPYHFGPSNGAHMGQKTTVSDAPKRKRATVSQLFLSGDNVRYRKIYITANAGCGKTSLSQKLTMTWCQAHAPKKELKMKYEGSELAAMKYFDLLLLLHLRDQSEPKCNLDDMIMQMVSGHLSRNTLYTKEFIQRLLDEKKCLIIVDGLDEWAHPYQCTKTPAVPHNNHPNSCTVITTSRPWKLGTIGLSKHNIDRHIEISELDDETREQLENNAVRILNEKELNIAMRDRADFDKEVKSVQIGDIIFIPYILLQLVCVFFDGLPIGKSKCEIYSNITEFTLKRGLNKQNLVNVHVHSNSNAVVPNCMNEKEICKLYFSLIMKLGKLAFFTLFGEKKESSLIFDNKVVAQYMTGQEIEFCLKVGLLCQSKDNSVLSERRYKVFFQHKSLQEFFSAIYIASEWERDVKSTILKTFTSLESTLEMGNLFVFVCGMSPEGYNCISGEIQKIVDFDSITNRYRSDNYNPFESVYEDDTRTMKSYQSMQVQCFKESLRSGNKCFSIHLYDIQLDANLTEDDFTALHTIINLRNGNVKSLQLSSPQGEINKFVKSLDPGVFTSLDTLRVEHCDKESVCLADILIKNARTLKSLTLSGTGIESLPLSDISLMEITGLTCLQSLCLYSLQMTNAHNLECLYDYIYKTATLTQIKLWFLDCSERDCNSTLNLYHLNKLKILHLYWVPCKRLHVNPTSLEQLEFRPHEEMTESACVSLLNDLREAPVLISLGLGNMSSDHMIQINNTLSQLQDQLQNIKLAWIDMGDVMPNLSPRMTHLECLELDTVKMSPIDWQKLFHSVGKLPQSINIKLLWIGMTYREWRELLLGLIYSVRIELYLCWGPSMKQWKTFVGKIKSTPRLSLLQDLSINDDGEASLTLAINRA